MEKFVMERKEKKDGRGKNERWIGHIKFKFALSNPFLNRNSNQIRFIINFL